MSYVIRNCPAYWNQVYSCTRYTETSCQSCTGCVMKCIKSKLDYLKCYINNDNSANLSKMNEIIDGTLKILDMQEVE